MIKKTSTDDWNSLSLTDTPDTIQSKKNMKLFLVFICSFFIKVSLNIVLSDKQFVLWIILKQI